MSVDTKSKAATKKKAIHPNTWVYFDGEFGRYHDIKLGLMTHALHYGTGVFEGIRAYWNGKEEQLHLLQAPAHYDRMRLRSWSTSLSRCCGATSSSRMCTYAPFSSHPAKRLASASTTSGIASLSM